MTTKKKATAKVKYEMTRGKIAVRLDMLTSRLDDVDTFETPPSEVSCLIESVRDELESLRDDLTARA